MSESIEHPIPPRAEPVCRMAAMIHPERFPDRIEAMSIDVMVEAMPAGMLDALLNGRIDVPTFRRTFRALCPELECGSAGLARLSMAMHAIGSKPQLFLASGLLVKGLYAGQGPLTDRRIWGAAAVCHYVVAQREPRFDPLHLVQSALALTGKIGFDTSKDDSGRPLMFAASRGAPENLNYDFFRAAIDGAPTRIKLVTALAWVLRSIAHGNLSSPPMKECRDLRYQFLNSELGFQTELHLQLQTLATCRRISADQARCAERDLLKLYQEVR